MKVLKIILLLIWAFLTFGLFLYSQTLKTAATRNHRLYEIAMEDNKKMSLTLDEYNIKMSKILDEYYENMVLLRNDNSKTLDIESIFENSFFLTKYEEKVKKEDN